MRRIRISSDGLSSCSVASGRITSSMGLKGDPGSESSTVSGECGRLRELYESTGSGSGVGDNSDKGVEPARDVVCASGEGRRATLLLYVGFGFGFGLGV